MTRKDFEQIATAIKASRLQGDHLSIYTIDVVEVTIADSIAANHPRFNRVKFLKAVK